MFSFELPPVIEVIWAVLCLLGWRYAFHLTWWQSAFLTLLIVIIFSSIVSVGLILRRIEKMLKAVPSTTQEN